MLARLVSLTVAAGVLAISCAPRSDVFVTLKRTACLGLCPDYDIEISKDGRVTYHGNSYVLVEGEHQWTISNSDLKELEQAFSQVSCPPGSELAEPVIDGPSISASITLAGSTKLVETNGMHNCQTTMADGREIYEAIDGITGASGLIEPNGATVNMMERISFDFRSQRAATALVRALDNRQVGIARALINRGAPMIGGSGPLRMGGLNRPTPAIEMAAPLADIALARLMIEKGALANEQARVAFLLASVSSGCPGMTELALNHFGDLKEVSPSIPWVIAAANAKMENEGTYWRDLYARPDYELWVNCFNPPAVFRQLLLAGADARGALPDGTTALHLVSDGASAQLLIDAGADPTARNEEGRTPLHESKDVGVVKVLLNAGGDVDARDKQRNTPLFGQYRAEIVEALLIAGADVNARNTFGWTPLFDVDSSAAARVLLLAGAEINARDNDGRTALEFVRDPGAAMTLADAGARVSTPAALEKIVKWATDNERKDLAKKLRQSVPLASTSN